MTYDDQDQWKHLARFVSKYSPKKWNGPKLRNRMEEIAEMFIMCTSCEEGLTLDPQTGKCNKCP